MPKQKKFSFTESEKAAHMGLRMPRKVFDEIEQIRTLTGWSQSKIIALHWRLARLLIQSDDHGKPSAAAEVQETLQAAAQAHRIATENEKRQREAELNLTRKLSRLDSRLR